MDSTRKRRHVKGGLALAMVGLLAGHLFAEPREKAGGQAPAGNPLNVLFIMSDQHNARALGCYGNREIKTPSLDRLAAEGVRFENAFCQTGQCCPSRYTIWTGRYAHSHGLRWNHVVEPLGEITIGEIFRDAGYATATIGKHHMQYDVRLHGFDHVVTLQDYQRFITAAGAEHCWSAGDWLPLGRKRFAGPVGTSHADNDHHVSGFLAKQAIQFLRANHEKPFCLWLSFHGPHVPLVASKQWMDLYDPDSLSLPPNFRDARKKIPRGLDQVRRFVDGLGERDLRRVLRCYYALVSQIDHNIGRVLDELERLGLAERTVVVYTADHGEMMGEHGAFRKAVLNYDATVRVPMIIRPPGASRKRMIVEELVGLIDLMPTLCEMAGLDYPDVVQGRSPIPLLEGRQTAWRDVIFSEIGYPRPALSAGLCVMARTKEHKYVGHDNAGDPMEELFDLRSDRWETVDQSANPEYAAVLTRLREAVTEWQESTDHAPMYPIEKKFRAGRRP